MFRMTVDSSFSAAHSIRGYAGPCCRLHGHNYRVVVRLQGTELDALGMLVDYTEVKRALAEVIAPFDHALLNELEPFTTINPTSEAIARLFYTRLRDILLATDDLRRRVQIVDVAIYESERQGVAYGEA